MLLLIPGPVTTRPEVREALRTTSPPGTTISARSMPASASACCGSPMASPASTPPCRCRAAAISSPRRRSAPSSRSGDKLLIPATGSYADRMIRLAREAGRVPVPLPLSADRGRPTPTPSPPRWRPIPTSAMSAWSTARPAAASCTTSPRSARWCARLGRRMIVDAVSAFGALPLDLSAQPEIDAVGFTSNKCLEGVPGMAFAVARIDRAGGMRRQRRKLVARSVRHLCPCAAQRLGQLPLHPAGAGAERVQRRARPVSMPRAASRRGWRATPRTCARCTTACAALG